MIYWITSQSQNYLQNLENESTSVNYEKKDFDMLQSIWLFGSSQNHFKTVHKGQKY